jgi:hypothetical protein
MSYRTTLRRLAFAALIAATPGCAPSVVPLPPAPHGVPELSVPSAANQTGATLVVDDPGMIGRYFGENTTTVPDVLASDLRKLLIDRGFRVVPATDDLAPALRTEIRRWEPYTADYSQVTVSLSASLVDPESGRALWSAQRTDWRVQTPDARNAPEASAAASRAIARALIEGWQPGGTPPAPTTPR